MSASSRPSRHRLTPSRRRPFLRPAGERALLIGATAVVLACGGLVAANAAENSAAGAERLPAAVNDGAVPDPVLPAYQVASTGLLSVTDRIEQAVDGTRQPTAAALAAAGRREAAATARSHQIAVAKAKAAARARAVARARSAAAARAAQAAAAKAAPKPAPAHKPAPVASAPAPKPVYTGDPTRTPAAMSSSRARAAIPFSVWRASATARKVVRLESGGSCTVVSGPYHGEWQMTVGLWKGHGGLVFASAPEFASCGQQDVVAYRIWVEQGWSPWTTA